MKTVKERYESVQKETAKVLEERNSLVAALDKTSTKLVELRGKLKLLEEMLKDERNNNKPNKSSS